MFTINTVGIQNGIFWRKYALLDPFGAINGSFWRKIFWEEFQLNELPKTDRKFLKMQGPCKAQWIKFYHYTELRSPSALGDWF